MIQSVGILSLSVHIVSYMRLKESLERLAFSAERGRARDQSVQIRDRLGACAGTIVSARRPAGK